jgi:hypothetical protein
MDGKSPTTNYAGIFNIGIIYVGGSKGIYRRAIIQYDLTAPFSGPPVEPDDEIFSAELAAHWHPPVGTTGHQVRADRITRTDWDYQTCTWNRYKTGSNWTTPGGDTAAPDIDIAYLSPAAEADQAIPGFEELVQDALDNRNSQLIFRLELVDEADNGINRLHSCKASPTAGLDADTLRLIVDHSVTQTAPIDAPGPPATLGADRPARATRPARGAPASRSARPVRGARGR